MHVRTLDPKEIIDLKKLWSVCFLSELNVEEAQKQEETSPSPFTPYGCFTDDGSLIAGMAVNHYPMNFDGNPVSLVGIGGVVTLPTHRRSGAIRQIFERLLSEERKTGAVFSGLYPFSHEFYRKFGYELSYIKRTYSFPVHSLSKYACEMDVRMLMPEDDRSALLPVYKSFVSRYNLGIHRSIELMNQITKSNPYAKNDYAYAIFEEGACVSYVVFKPENNGNNRILTVKDYAFSTVSGFHKLLGFLSRMSAQYTRISMSFPDDLPIASLIDSPYDLTVSETPYYMIRVLNTEKALSSMKRSGNFDFVIEVSDAFLPENGGKWRVTPGACEKTELSPDVSMSIQTFSQMIAGFLSFDEACLKQDVHVSSNEETLRRVFTKRAVYSGVYY